MQTDDSLKITCEHYTNESHRIKGRCAEHKGEEIKACKACVRLQKKDPNICLAKGCGKSSAKEDELTPQENYYVKNNLLKAGFISLKAFSYRSIGYIDDKAVEENQMLQAGFGLFTLEDWFKEQDDYIEMKMVRDKRNVVSFHSAWEKTQLRDKLWGPMQNIFSSTYDIPQFFQSCVIDNSNILITGGVYEICNEEGKIVGMETAADTVLFHLEPYNYDINFDTRRVQNGDQNPVYMNYQRVGHQLIKANGKVFAIGGNNEYQYHNSVEAYDTKTKTWTEVASLSEPRSRFVSLVKDVIVEKNGKQVVENKFIYVIGGYKNFGNEFVTNQVEKYDVAKNTWTTVPMKKSLTNSKIFAGGWGFVYPGDGQMYVLGALGKNRNAEKGIYRFEEINGKGNFTFIGNMYVARASPKGTITYTPDLQYKSLNNDSGSRDKNIQVVEDVSQKKYQVTLFGGCTAQDNLDKLTIEYFEIKDGKLENHQIQDVGGLLGGEDWPEFFQTQSMIPISGFLEYHSQ